MTSAMVAISIPRTAGQPPADPADETTITTLTDATARWVAAVCDRDDRERIIAEARWLLDVTDADTAGLPAVDRCRMLSAPVLELLIDVATSLYDGREWAVLPLGPCDLWVTGGMSDGSAPTDVGGLLTDLDAIDVDDLLWTAATGLVPHVELSARSFT